MNAAFLNLMTSPMMLSGMGMLSDLNDKNKEMKKRALADYEHALKLPRKQKKIAKKRAILDYSIACYFDDVWGNDFDLISKLF